MQGGEGHSLALCANGGTVWSWGEDLFGALGDDATLVSKPTPVAVATLTGIIAIAAGYHHSLALKSDGTVWSWGQDGYGQLGNDASLVDKPTPVAVSTLTGIIAIAGGKSHSLALKSDGTVWSWGEDVYGQLGNDAALVSQPTPVAVATLTGIIAIAAEGYGHSHALKSDGTVWSWGWDNNGQLGNDAALVNQPMPVAVAALTGITAIAAGEQHSLALKNDGTVWSWGGDGWSQLGDNATLVSQPTPVAVSTITGITAIAAGSFHSLALRSDGTLWSWGYNNNGQLGDNTTIDKPTPVAVSTLTGIVAIAAGGGHSLALKNDGTVWSWGWDGYGQLGDDAPLVNKLTPVAVAGRFCPVGSLPLPIELLSFSGKNQGEKNKIYWTTATETNNNYFTVERSIDAVNFEVVGMVAGSGTTGIAHSYSLTDDNPYSITYYRLKQTDYDGKFAYSALIFIAIEDKDIDLIHVFSNPVSYLLQYSISSKEDTRVNVTMIDMLGRIAAEQNLPVVQGVNNFTMNVSAFSSGSYLFQVSSSTGNYKIQKHMMVVK